MSPDQHFQRRRVALVAPPVQELGVAEATAVRVGDSMQTSQDCSELVRPHGNLAKNDGLSD
jgi:hypothetical protein